MERGRRVGNDLKLRRGKEREITREGKGDISK